MKINHQFLLLATLSLYLLQSCAPRVKSSISNKDYSRLAVDAKVFVLHAEELLPVDSEYIGNLKVGDSGLSVDCGYKNILAAAKKEARKKGANLIEITTLKKPSIWSTCYRLKARLYLNNNQAKLASLEESLNEMNASSLPKDADYAVVHFYRPSYFPGSIIGYEIKNGDGKVLGKLSNGSSFKYVTTQVGELQLAAKNLDEPISLDVEAGQEYYFRCGIKTGFPVAKPDFYLVENAIGKKELKEM